MVLDIDDLENLVSYNPATGEMLWKERPLKYCHSEASMKWWNKRFAGSCATTTYNGKGGYKYLRIKLFKKYYSAHRIAWSIYYKEHPPKCIDHINRNAVDNRIENLRNGMGVNDINMSRYSNNTSGFTGVCWAGNCNKWRANGHFGGDRITLGFFDNFEDAVNASKAFKVRHGFQCINALRGEHDS